MDPVLAARSAFDRREWSDAHRLLTLAGTTDPGVEDLERLAVAAYMVGQDADCTDAWTRAHQAHVRKGAVAAAARCAFWSGWGLF